MLGIASPEGHLSREQATLPRWDVIFPGSAGESFVNRGTLRPEYLLGAVGVARGFPTDVSCALSELALPDARRSWSVEASFLSRAMDRVPRLVPTSLEKLLACPLRFVLESVAKIRGSRIASV